jgi:hypothetical protein
MNNITISDSVHIRKRFLRSVHLERDAYDSAGLSDYIITPQARQVLNSISDGLLGESTSRAWTVTGPYGTGKSAFALYLSRLLSNIETENNIAWQLLYKIDLSFADDLLNKLKDGSTIAKPFLTVPITARRAPVSLCLLEGLCKSLQLFHGNKRIKSLRADIESRLSSLQNGVIDSHYVSQVIENLASLVNESEEYRGVLVIVDELGKLFEYSVSHPEQGDMFVIQEIAEASCRSGKEPLLFVGILHQSFEQYIQYADILTRNEWAKIHGRFTDIAFIEPPEQMIRLIANAIERPGNMLPQQSNVELQKLAEIGVNCRIFPSTMKESEVYDLCMKAYPLHPSVLAALPHLFRRFAQNERSLFSYLSSYEPFSFQDFVSSHKLSSGDQQFIRLSDLFDYFIANFSNTLIRQQYARKWIEASDVLDRSQELNKIETKVLKTIGILTILGEISHFRAEEKVIQFALGENESDDELIKECLQKLRNRSLITFRKFNQSYRIWEGSDIDVEERISEGRRRTAGQLGIAETIQKYLPQRPIVARRHSYETGALRFFRITYIDEPIDVSTELNSIGQADGIILVCLPSSLNQAKVFQEWAYKSDYNELIVAIPQRIGSIHLALDELRAIHWVWENTPQLRDDKIARRELSERMNEVESALIRSLDRLLDPREEPIGSECQWYHKGKLQPINAPRDVSQLLSTVCDQLYCESPRILNELINRRSLSTTSSGARRNLIERMLTHADEPLLGIEGYPPERSIYESVLLASGLHRELEEKWFFSDPIEDEKLRFGQCWQALKNTVFDATTEPYAIDKLFKKLSKPPYGVMPGVLPVLLCAFMLSHPDEMSLYREGSFITEPSIADFEVLMRRPEMFSIAGYQITGARKAVVERIADGLNVNPSIVQVIRSLVRMVKSLPDHAWRTKRLSAQVLAVREAFNQAKSPEKLLFYDLTKALGLPDFSGTDEDLSHVEQFFNELNNVIQEWSKATSSVIEQARDTLLNSCGLQSGLDGWNQLKVNSAKLEKVVAHPSLLPFLKRVVMDGDDQTILESALAFVADRPPRSWTDADIDRFPSLAGNIGQLFIQAMQTTSAFDSQRLELTPDEYKQSQAILGRIKEYLKQEDGQKVSNRIIRTAIMNLLKELENESN